MTDYLLLATTDGLGVYARENAGWHALRRGWGHDLKHTTRWGRACGCVITFIAVVIGWVLFRSADLTAAVAMLKAMAGFNGCVEFGLPGIQLGRVWCGKLSRPCASRQCDYA